MEATSQTSQFNFINNAPLNQFLQAIMQVLNSKREIITESAVSAIDTGLKDFKSKLLPHTANTVREISNQLPPQEQSLHKLFVKNFGDPGRNIFKKIGYKAMQWIGNRAINMASNIASKKAVEISGESSDTELISKTNASIQNIIHFLINAFLQPSRVDQEA